jgi:hypothetical protein
MFRELVLVELKPFEDGDDEFLFCGNQADRTHFFIDAD